jgi:hypothetical protein
LQSQLFQRSFRRHTFSYYGTLQLARTTVSLSVPVST